MIAFLSIQEPNEYDWSMLARVMNYLTSTVDEALMLKVNNKERIWLYVDATFTVHKDMKTRTGADMTTIREALILMFIKQKVNAQSETEATLVWVIT